MSKRFLIFLLAMWYPLMLGGLVAVKHFFGAETQAMSFGEILCFEYAYLLIFMGPLIIKAFLLEDRVSK